MAFTYGSVTNCKTYNGQTRTEYQCRLGYQVNSQDIATNSSNITLRLEVRSINSTYKTYGYKQTTTIDGTALAAATFDMRDTNVWQVFGERTITVYHNADGTYSASKSGSFVTTANTSYSLRSGSASVTVAPATIPRYANFTNHYVSRVSTSSITVYWDADANCDALQCSLNGGAWFDVSGYPEYTLTGLAANTTYSIKTRVRRTDSQLWTETGTIYGTTYALTIPTISLKAKSVNAIEVNVGVNVEVSSIQYRIRQSGGSFGGWQYSNVFTGLNPNTTYIIEVYMVSKQSGEGGSASLRETTYDIARLTSAPNMTIGETPTIGISNPSGQTIKVYMENLLNGNPDVMFTDIITVTGRTSYTFNPNAALMYSAIPNSTVGYLRYSIMTECNGITYWAGLDREFYVSSANAPIFNDFWYEDLNEKTIALTGNNRILVKDFSNLMVVIPVANKAIAQNSATMKSYRLNVGNMSSVAADYSSSDEVKMIVNSINSASMTVTAIDSRQLSTPVPKTAEFKAYGKPVVTALAATRRDGGVGDQVDLSFNGTWWNDNFGAVQNSIKSVKYYYKATTSSTWIEGSVNIIPTISYNNFSGSVLVEGPKADTKGFDVSTAYNIKIIVTDELSSSTEFQTILGKGTPALAIYESGVAINQMYDESIPDFKLQVNGNVKVNSGIWALGDIAVEGKLHHKNSFVNNFTGNYGENGYVLFAELTITGSYVDQPIEFRLTRRNQDLFTTLNVRFHSNSGTDPWIRSLSVSGGYIPIYISKLDTSKWGLFVLKSEGYDNIMISDYHKGDYLWGINVAFTNRHYYELPSGAIAATYKGQAEYGTDEVLVGTWQGDLLYRKTIVTATPSSTDGEFDVGELPSDQLALISLRGSIWNDSYHLIIPVPFYAASDNFCYLYVRTTDKKIVCRVSNAAYCNRELLVFVEYTKSSD